MQPRFDIAAYRPAAAKTPYARPLEVGGFSRIDGELHFDKRALRIYSAPRLPAPLSSGFDDFVPKRDDKANAEQCLLAAVERYAEQTAKAYFVTYRNNLNKLLATLQCPNDDWCIGVKRLADQRWLLRVRDTPRRRDEERSQSDAQMLQSYYGYRFEALCTGHDPSTPVDANDEYVGLFNCKLGDHRLAVAAEIDCVDDAGTYVELKTNKLLASKRLVGTFERFKMFKFWVQPYLVGTPRVIVGFRDEDELRKVQAFDTLALPGLAAAWRPRACLGFADAVLTWLRAALDAADGDAYVVTYDPEARAISFAHDGGAKRRRRA
jgi:RAT1-interacting protein